MSGESRSFMANAAVYLYSKASAAWEKKAIARVYVFEDVLGMKFRVVARSVLQPNDVLINTWLFNGLNARIDNGVFVQWADKRWLYGLRFDTNKDASQFLKVIHDAVDQLAAATSTDKPKRTRVELDEKFTSAGVAVEILLSDYNRFFGHYGQTYDTLPHIPPRLRESIEFLETQLHVEYLLGIQLDWKDIQLAEELKDFNSPLDVTTYDPNIVGEFIKLYYKDQAPLITVDQFEPETSYNELADYEQQAQFLADLVTSLPERNRQLLQVLVWLLANIAWSGEYNKMSASLLAAIFAPYLLRPTALDYKTPQKVKLKSKLVF